MQQGPQILALCSLLQIFTCGTAYIDQTVEIVELSIPRYPKAGDDVVLHCRFRLGGSKHKLYTVNWWRGKDQFFTFKTSNFEPKQAFHFRGIDVVENNSSEDTVFLRRVTQQTSGLYKCEVMGEGPAFRTAVDAKRMTVIVPPERLEISHKVKKVPQNLYRLEDLVQLNCTAYRVKPSPQMTWTINNIEVSRTEKKRYKDLEDHRGLVTATLALRFLAARYFINKKAKVSCSIEVQGHEFKEEQDLWLNPSAAFHLYSSGGWRWSLCWYIGSFMILLVTNSFRSKL